MDAAVALHPESPAVRWQRDVAAAGGLLLGLGALVLGSASWRHGALLVIGALLGVSLYHAAFGFTSAYRRAIVERDVAGVLAQLVMLGLAMLLFAPLLMVGEVFGSGSAARWRRRAFKSRSGARCSASACSWAAAAAPALCTRLAAAASG